jgi:hypothetical protein
MIFPSVSDHGLNVLAGDLQHGGQTRGDDCCQPAHPDCETTLVRGAALNLRHPPVIANFRPTPAFGVPRGHLIPKKSALVGNLTKVTRVHRVQDRAPLSWTNERADTLFVCE